MEQADSNPDRRSRRPSQIPKQRMPEPPLDRVYSNAAQRFSPGPERRSPHRKATTKRPQPPRDRDYHDATQHFSPSPDRSSRRPPPHPKSTSEPPKNRVYSEAFNPSPDRSSFRPTPIPKSISEPPRDRVDSNAAQYSSDSLHETGQRPPWRPKSTVEPPLDRIYIDASQTRHLNVNLIREDDVRKRHDAAAAADRRAVALSNKKMYVIRRALEEKQNERDSLLTQQWQLQEHWPHSSLSDPSSKQKLWKHRQILRDVQQALRDSSDEIDSLTAQESEMKEKEKGKEKGKENQMKSGQPTLPPGAVEDAV
jgi:hypothetical protein